MLKNKIFFCAMSVLFFVSNHCLAAEPPKANKSDGSTVAASATADDWKVIFFTDKESNTHTGVEFHKNGKKAFGLKFDDTYRIGFMVPVGDSKHRFAFKGIYKRDEQNFKYQDYLIDIKGNGDKRFLLVTNWGGGNHGPYASGYLIDTKDDFAITGRIPTGELYDYPMPNEELIFTYYEGLDYFTPMAPVYVFAEYKLQKGKMPIWIEKVGDIKNFSLEGYRKILEDKSWDDSRKYALATLYCNLASLGLLKHFCTSAQRLGFSNKEIAEASEYYGKELRKSKLYKHIKKLNGNLKIR